MLSHKNLLQEYLQQLRLPLPKYTTTRAGGPEHLPLWKSSITIEGYDKFQCEKSFNKKVDAENNIAEIALNLLRNTDEKQNVTEDIQIIIEQKFDFNSLKPVVVLIDLENQPNTDSIPVDINASVIGVIGYLHSQATKYTWFPKFVINSAVKDAADHALSFLCGKLSPKTTDVVIITGDHYGESLVKCVETFGVKCVHYRTFEDARNFLNINE